MGFASQMHHHAGTGELLNVTFMRVFPEATLKVNVPLKFIGEDACVGIRKGEIWDTVLVRLSSYLYCCLCFWLYCQYN